MNPEKPPPPGDADEEVSALIETLHETGQRLEELTAGEVDTVTDRRGRTVLLRRAQDHMRHNEAAKQASILNGLPAYIALLDPQGFIISVNKAWREFASPGMVQGPGHGIGLNYLEICSNARGDGASGAHQVAAGLRSVLAGSEKSFSIEYPVPSPWTLRWFLLTATPLADDPPHGAVVMQLDVTAQRQAKGSLHASELRFRQMAENIRDVFFLQNLDGSQIYYVSPAYEQIWGRTCESLYANPASWTEAIHPDDRASTYRKYKKGMSAGKFKFEFRIVRPDGPIRWIEVRGFPVRDDAGKLVRLAGVAEDITERKNTDTALLESRQMLRLVLDAIPVRVFWKDANSNYLGCNQPFALDAGLHSPEELIGKNDFAMGWADQAEAYRADDRHVIDTGKSKLNYEEPQTSPEGRRIWLRTSKIPLRDVEGNIKGVLGTYEDITERKQAERELHESRQRLDGIVTSAMDAIVTVDDGYRIVLSNPAADKMFGYTDGELQGQPLDLLIPERFRAGHSAHIAAFGKTGFTARRVGALRSVSGLRKDGTEFPVEAAISKDESTGRLFFTAILRDMTEHRQAQARIAYLNRVYAMLSGINTLIVRVRDRDELFREACRISVDAGGFRMALIARVDRSVMKMALVASAGVDEAFLTALKEHFSLNESALLGSPLLARAIREKNTVVISDLQSNPEVVFSKKYAEFGVRSMTILPLIASNEVAGVLVLYASESEFFQEEELKLLAELAGDIAYAIDHIDKQARLDYLAYYDALTGLANRRLFLERVAQYLRSAASDGHKLALYLIDLERFKNINDSLGRPAGDTILQQVAAWLTHNAGDATLLTRLDADHFAAVLPNVKGESEVARFLDKSIEAFLAHPFRLNGGTEFRIALKGGVALFPDDGADADTLFRHAEVALKRAKVRGDRYLFYTQRMTEAVAGKFALENQLRQALDHGEFVLHYQPKVNIQSGKMTSAEALIRWNDPRTGLVPPGRFIPILEETGLIYEVGHWALRQAIEDYLRWRSAGFPVVRIAVNVSPLQLRHLGFIDEIRKVIGINAHAPAGLELEITESLIMEDVQHSIASLQAIRAMGVSIAIDDFGTGFSSLSYLSKLPLDTLKIDISFVAGMTAGPQELSLVSTIINLAHSLKLKVVAEGVETEEQSRLLRLLGCDEMQGFFFSEPVPGGIFETRYLAPPPAV